MLPICPSGGVWTNTMRQRVGSRCWRARETAGLLQNESLEPQLRPWERDNFNWLTYSQPYIVGNPLPFAFVSHRTKIHILHNGCSKLDCADPSLVLRRVKKFGTYMLYWLSEVAYTDAAEGPGGPLILSRVKNSTSCGCGATASICASLVLLP